MMRQFCFRLLHLTWGLFLFSFGIVMTINAHIGYAPWDVFHVGLAKTTGISIGTVAILVGIMVGIISLLLGEKLGLGTIFNMIFIGVFLDIIIGLHVIPVANHFMLGILMLITGLLIISLGTYFYMKTALGAGPRDSLMVALNRKTRLPIGICRGTIELLVVLIGWSLGGMVGIGTVIAAFTIGFFIQITFGLLKFDATKVNHETMDYTYKKLFLTQNKDNLQKKKYNKVNESCK